MLNVESFSAQSMADDESAVLQVEPSHLKQISNAEHIAKEFNRFVVDQDFESNDIKEDLDEGPQHSIIMEQIQTKLNKKWNNKKRNDIHQRLQEVITTSNANNNTSSKPRQSNLHIVEQFTEIAGPLLPNINEEENIQNNEITYVNNYKDIRFRDYHFKHIAQFINDQTEIEYNNDKNNEFDLKNIIFNNNINGRILKQNLNENYIKNTFNKNIKDGKHKFKKATIKYLCESIDNINDNLNENDVLKFLYFAEAQIIQNAIINLEIDGKTFLMIDTKEWSKRLKQFSIPLSVSQGYYTKIETHKMESALSLEPAKSDSISIKYDNDDINEKKIDNNNDKNKSKKYLIAMPDGAKHTDFSEDMDFNITPDTNNMNEDMDFNITDNLSMNNEDNNNNDQEESKEFDPIDEEEEEFRDLNDTHLHHIRQQQQDDDHDDSDSDNYIIDHTPSILGQQTQGRYPIYINKALFHVSDDENLEVLVDEAVLKLLSFNELWQDRDGFVSSLYKDQEFSGAVKRVYETLAAAYEREKFGFFEEFVSKQYAREIQEHELQMERFYDENAEEDLMETPNDDYDNYEDELEVLGGNNKEWVFEVDSGGEYKIYERNKDKKSMSSSSKNIHKIHVKQNPKGFSWAMFKSGKRIKTHYNKESYHGGYWKICDEESVSKSIHEWHNKLSDINKRKKQKIQFQKKGKVKKWIGPPIPVKHLNIIIGLVNHHYAEMIDPNKRKKIWKKKRRKEPIFAKFLPKEMYEKNNDDDNDDDDNDNSEGDNNNDKKDEKNNEDDDKNITSAETYIAEEKRRTSEQIQQTNVELAHRTKRTNSNYTNAGKSVYKLFSVKKHNKIEYIYDEKEEESVHLKIFDSSNGKEYLYDLFWWNSTSRSKVNAFCLKRSKDVDFKWQHYLFFRTNYYDLLSWEWYDNDQAEYQEYDASQLNVIKQLEATFQSNIQENFPLKYFHSPKNEKEPKFNYCCLPELQTHLAAVGIRVGLGFVLRFSFTKNKRISNIEQLSVWRDNPEFARNVRRMYDGKNSIYSYFKDKNEYIEEWKRLYLLDTDEQQMFFWAHIITVCAAMKYTQIEFENQMVSFAFERVNTYDSSVFSNMDFNDVQREIRDMISWEGFLIPPENLFQTNDVMSLDENDLTGEDWFKKQGYATILTQWQSKHFRKKKIDYKSKIKSRQIYCGHDIDPRYQTYWQTTTGYTYCDSCAKLLQFAECIRKFVLEYENDEVVELLWPWYRNTHHAGSIEKYGRYINKYNLSHLYMEYDLLPDFTNSHDNDNDDDIMDNESFLCCWNRSQNKYTSSYRAEHDNHGCFSQNNGDKKNDGNNGEKTPHIRHRRKFAAQLLLGGWDTLRNLNIIRQQLLPIMRRFVTSEIVDEETHYGDGKGGRKGRRAVQKHRLNVEFKETDYLKERRRWWTEKIGDINSNLRQRIEENDWETLFNFEHHESLEIQQQHAVVFNEFVRVFLEDDREIEREADPEEYDREFLGGSDEYFRQFLAGVSRKPRWWGTEHDTLLLELALRFNYSSQYFLQELTGTKKRYYQYRLRHKTTKVKKVQVQLPVIHGGHTKGASMDLDVDDDNNIHNSRNIEVPVPFLRQMSGRQPRSPWDNNDNKEDDNEFDDIKIKEEEKAEKDDEEVGYQEFKAWCQVNENIMHRLKYITFLIIQKLSQCSPSIIDLRIPNKTDQPLFGGESYIFLNDYMAKTHIEFAQNYNKEPDDLKEVAGTINEASKYIISHRQNWKQIQKDLQVVAHSMPAISAPPLPVHARQISRKKSTDQGLLSGRMSVRFEPKTEIARAKYQKTMRNVMKGMPKRVPTGLNYYNNSQSAINIMGGGVTSAFSQISLKIVDDNPRKGHGISEYGLSRSTTQTTLMQLGRIRTRDPFLRRDLTREFQEVVQSFDLLQNGELMAQFIIQLLKTKQLPSLWQALGILLRTIPYKLALQILHESRGELRHGDPGDVAKVCREVMDGSNFLVPAALYLAEFMEKNANEDLARAMEWADYSKHYERIAQQQINSIESDHLLGALLDIPIYIKDLNLLQLALEQERIQFLNNERINGVMSHVWYAAAFLDPTDDIEKGNQTWVQVFTLLFQRPFQFYLTPMGFNWTTGLCYLAYLIGISIFILYKPVYPQHPVSYGEILLWTCNIGYILNEVLEFVDQGRQYFAVNGLLNYFDIMISFLWMVLISIRIHSYTVGDYDENNEWISPYKQGGINGDKNDWLLSRIYTTIWAIQLVLLCIRSLAVFLSSQYIGILFRMLELMMGQIVRFGFFIGTILIGFLFGLFYIDNIPNRDDNFQRDDDNIYDHFLYLFTSLVGMAEVETHLKVGDEEDENDPMKTVAQVYSIFFIVFGTILSMNLLIALMTAEFERVRSRANTEYAYARAELTYDLSHRNRFMAPPLNIFVLLIAVIIHIINFFPAILFPDTLNIYYYLSTGHYHFLRNFNVLNYICLKCCCWNDKKKEKKKKKKRKKNKQKIDFDASASAADLMHEFTNNNNNSSMDSFQTSCIDRCLGTIFCWFKCYSCCTVCKWQKCLKRCRKWQSSRRKKSHTFLMNTTKLVLKYYLPQCGFGKNVKWNVYHASCYNCIAKQRIEDKFESHAFHGIAMNQYFNIYETQRKTKLDALDKNLLKHLTINTLFCQYCYRPFDKENITNQLITPFWALADIVSCYFFFVFVWWVLIILIGFVSILTWCKNSCNDDLASGFSDDSDDAETDEFREYDREYWGSTSNHIEITDLKVNN